MWNRETELVSLVGVETHCVSQETVDQVNGQGDLDRGRVESSVVSQSVT